MSVNANKKNKSMDTLKKAVFVSVFGAIISGVVACMGTSTTVFMDFCRCLLDGFTTVVTFIVFSKINNGTIDKKNEQKYQEYISIATGVVMMCTSILLALVSILSFSPVISEGNNVPSLFTTGICMCINFRVCRSYKKALEERYDSIIDSQCTMYRVKTCINAFVFFIIGIMIFVPTWSAIPYVDLIGTCVMSIFIMSEGFKNINKVPRVKKGTVRMMKKIACFVSSI